MSIGRIVEKATLFHAQCMFLKHNNGPMIDLLRDFDLDHQGRMYVSVQAATELGQLVGMVPGHRLEEAADVIELTERERDEALDQVAALEAKLGRIESLEHDGFRAKRRPGRAPTTERTAA